WWEREYKHLESSKYTDAVPHIKYGFWMAYQAGGAELVEALEKSRTQSSKWLEGYHKAVSIGARYEERIAELEEAEQKLCAANVTLDARAELAERRLAEMESRTVKLPKLKMLEDYLAEVAIEERKQILVGVKLEFHRALAAAGIKVEAE
ncbi:hypothetical protein DD572_18510, partial [Klebsiella pneumoniae]